MENKLEQLLNSLIEKGRKPFGKNNRGNVTIDKTIETKSPFFDFDYHNMSVSTRELISKESGLWQFVCENGMINKQQEEKLIEIYDNLRGRTESVYDDSEYEYRLIESSLKDESELEDFLLQNINVEGKHE